MSVNDRPGSASRRFNGREENRFKVLRALYTERVLPVAVRAVKSGRMLMAGGPDATMPTYYATRAKRTMS